MVAELDKVVSIVLLLLSWYLMDRARREILRNLKRNNQQEYILLTRGGGWLERGYYTPSDVGLVLRLHVHILKGSRNIESSKRVFYFVEFFVFLAVATYLLVNTLIKFFTL